jgi:hypothetical protein
VPDIAGWFAVWSNKAWRLGSLVAGVITDEQVRQAELTEVEWSLVIPLLAKAGYDKIHEIQIQRRIPAGA